MMSVPVKIAIAGASGRMGRMLIEAVLRDSGAELHAAFEREGSEFVGRDPGEFVGQATSVRITTDVAAGVRGANCLIDFTRPEATLVHLEACQAAGVGMVIGTTGFQNRARQRWQQRPSRSRWFLRQYMRRGHQRDVQVAGNCGWHSEFWL